MTIALVSTADPAQVLDLVSVADIKAELRISYTKEDDLIEAKILAAYDWMCGPNGWLNRPVIGSAYLYSAPAFTDTITLPAPVLVVSQIQGWTSGAYVTVPTSVYATDLSSGLIYLKPDQVWPDTDVYPDAVTVAFTSGAGLGTGADVKAKYPAIAEAVKKLACDLFRFREDSSTDGRITEVNKSVINDSKKLAGRYKMYRGFA
jgi:hypothetical protein